MTNRKTTRRALVMSLLSLLLCCSMLVGTTFAWFTDSVTSGNNKIVAGNLDVELYYKNDTTADWVKVTKDTNVFKTGTLWEPGHTEVVKLKVVNEGTLSLKYQLGVNVASETGSKNVLGKEFKLSDYIKFGVVEGDKSYDRAQAIAAVDATATALNVAYGTGTVKLDPKTQTNTDNEDIVTMVVYMPTTVENEANFAKGEAIPTILLGLNLYATQVEAEDDSFGTDYDKDAWGKEFKVYTAEDLQTAIDAGETNITLMDDITLDTAIVIPASASTYSLRASGITINMNGKSITTEAAYDNSNAGASSALVNNGVVTLVGEGEIKALNNYTVRNYGTMVIDGITVANGIMNFADLTVESGNISNSRTGKHTIYGNDAKLTLNGGRFHNDNPGNATIFAYAGEVIMNGGEYTIADGTATLGWTSCLLDAQGNAKYTINGGTVKGEIRDYNKNTTVYGGTFTHNSVKNFVADGTVLNNNGDGTMTVVALSGDTTMPDGAVLDLNGQEITGTVVAEGDLTIKGDAKIKTLKATNGGTITVEDGKTLSLTNFSFGTKANNTAEYVIEGGTVEASYGFFQHGKYELRSHIKTGYMYYSYGSDITVYGTVESEGKGDGLDYVRGKVTIANGGKSIHQKSLWVGQPASWGAMNATLIVEEGGYVQANSLSIYDGSKLQVAGTTAGEVTTVVCNTISNTGAIEVIGSDTLTATVTGNKIVLN